MASEAAAVRRARRARRGDRRADRGRVATRRGSMRSCCSAKCSGWDASGWSCDAAENVDPVALERFGALVARRVAREPVAYILGRKEFRWITLQVDRRVLIPRPETELLVEVGLELPHAARVVDVGTGSGAVALALKQERPDLYVVGTDVSADAVAVARENAQRLGLDVKFVEADLLGGIERALRRGAGEPALRSRGGRRSPRRSGGYEPAVALFGGEDGLGLTRRLLEMVAGAELVALEMGFGQAGALLKLLHGAGFSTVDRLRDLAGHERVVVGAAVSDAEAFERCLAVGGVAVFPADTVYGLACDPENRFAVERLYLLKRRPTNKPSAVMFFSLEPALAALPELGERTLEAMRRLLPGAVSLLVPNPAAALPAGLRGGSADARGAGRAGARARGRHPAGAPVERQPRGRAGCAADRRDSQADPRGRRPRDRRRRAARNPLHGRRSAGVRGERGVARRARGGGSARGDRGCPPAWQFHFDPASYDEMIRSEVPAFERFEEAVAGASGAGARRMLELGTGTGETARRLLERHPGATLVGIDVSEPMLEEAGRRLGSSRVELRVGRLEDPLPEGPFDLVASALCVHHLPGAEKADLFARVASALRPGGRFVLGDVVVPEDPERRAHAADPGLRLPEPAPRPAAPGCAKRASSHGRPGSRATSPSSRRIFRVERWYRRHPWTPSSPLTSSTGRWPRSTRRSPRCWRTSSSASSARSR